MRILHTSDWHLGRSFHGEGMLGHQAAYVDHLLETVQSQEVDLVVVSGDVYDRALPPVDAVALASEAIGRLAASRARVVITSGNHDSAHRLGFAADLIDAAGVHLRTNAGSVGAPVLLEDEHGPVAVHGIPYLEPDVVREAWQLASRGHQASLAEAMRRIRADLESRPGTRSVVMAHAFVAGGEASESERDISVGGVSVVPAALFRDIDYTALGHLHGRHTLTDTIRYSGSPLAYSFSEAAHRKGSWLVTLGPSGLASSEFVDAPVPRPLARLHGRIDDLLGDSRLEKHTGSWAQVTLTDPVRPRQAMDRLRSRFPHTLALRFEPDVDRDRSGRSRRDITGRSDHQVALDFVAEVRGTVASASETALLLDACDSCRPDAEADQLVVST